jgi:cytidine deaminase
MSAKKKKNQIERPSKSKKKPEAKPKAKAKSMAKPSSALDAKATLGASRVPTALLDQLVQDATAVREHAYAPYSGYMVGAAIATRGGATYVGCNVENSTFGATICAERGAIMQMVAAGDTDPIACAVVTKDGGSPCGICRQVLAEFSRDMPVVLVALAAAEGESGTVVHLADLLPLAFRLER